MLLVIFTLLVAGCSTETQNDTPQEADPEQNEPTQEELNEQLKQEAVEANFVEINGDNVKLNTKIFAEGVVSVVMKPGPLGEFSLTTEEGNGFGMYTIKNFDLNNPVGDSDAGKQITIWGVYSGKEANTGMPIITSIIIDLDS